MAKVTIILEDDAVGDDPTAVRMANMQIGMVLTEDEKGCPPSIAVLTAHHFRHLWVDQGIPLVQTRDRVLAEIEAARGGEAPTTPQNDVAAAIVGG